MEQPGNQLAKFGQGTDLAQQEDRQQHMMETASHREAAEVQAAMVVAKRFPRDVTQSVNRITLACNRKGLAESALYMYPRGGTKVEGPSIRMAEMLAQNWGNVDCGIKELEQRDGESTVMAYAWDLETNTRVTKVFTVKHERTKNVGYGENRVKVKTVLDDPRDIYEMVANNGARRLRACILAVIPGDIQDMAIAACRHTLMGDSNEPMIDRVRKMVVAFDQYFGVTTEHLEQRLGHNIDVTDIAELRNLGSIYNSLRDGQSKREDWFDIAPAGTGGDASKLTPGKKNTAKKPAAKKTKPKPEREPAPTEPEAPEAPAEAEAEAEENLFAGEAPAAIDDTDPATDTDIALIKQLSDMKLVEAGLESTGHNRNTIVGFACIGQSIPDLNNPTHAEARQMLAAVKTLTKEGTQEALEA